MTGPATPGQEGPSYGPPPLPEGWIAQWDGVSRKYYFVQLSTGASQWDTPTHAAPTGPTPQATPQGGIEHPYGTPAGGQGQMITNADGSQSVRHADGTVEPIPADGDRSLGGNIGNFAMNQLMGGKKHGSGSSNQSGLMGIAGQFLGSGGKHNSSGGGHSSSPAAGIVGALAGSLLGGGKKPNNQQTSYSGAQPHGQSHGGGFMESVGGMFGGGHHQGSSQQGNNFGYSQHNSQQGGYTGNAPPTSYQPGGSTNTPYNPPSQHGTPQQHGPPSQHGAPPTSYPPNQSQNQPYNAHGSTYGAATGPQQPAYGAASQPHYSPPYGGVQHQDSYGGGHPPQQQYPGPPSYGQPGGPQYGGPPTSGNLPQPQHGHFQGLHNAEHSGGLYGAGGPPPIPMGTHPQHGQQQGPPPQGGYGAPPPGGYGGQQQGRW